MPRCQRFKLNPFHLCDSLWSHILTLPIWRCEFSACHFFPKIFLPNKGYMAIKGTTTLDHSISESIFFISVIENFWMKSVLCAFFAVYHIPFRTLAFLMCLSQILIRFDDEQVNQWKCQAFIFNSFLKIFMFNVWQRNWPGRPIFQKMDLEKSSM